MQPTALGLNFLQTQPALVRMLDTSLPNIELKPWQSYLGVAGSDPSPSGARGGPLGGLWAATPPLEVCNQLDMS